ncbi:hypothetical protein [Thauera humireducens]|uniref:hypothetical protein n=1 Tax=Thauera humireducens TaxID=1134435 RepID=UPI00311D3D08
MSPRQLRARLTLGIALGGLLLLLAVPLGYLVDKAAWANGVIEEVEPRHARLLGLEEMGERIERERARPRPPCPRWSIRPVSTPTAPVPTSSSACGPWRSRSG